MRASKININIPTKNKKNGYTFKIHNAFQLVSLSILYQLPASSLDTKESHQYTHYLKESRRRGLSFPSYSTENIEYSANTYNMHLGIYSTSQVFFGVFNIPTCFLYMIFFIIEIFNYYNNNLAGRVHKGQDVRRYHRSWTKHAIYVSNA